MKINLGTGDQVIARDSTSNKLMEAQSLPDVGYMRQLNAEGILSLKPTLLLTSELASPSLVLTQIEQIGVNVVTISGETTLDNIPNKIRHIASALHKEQQGDVLIHAYEQQLAAISREPLTTKVLFILNHSGMMPMAAGQSTAADAIITASGARNAMQGFSRYKPLSQEGVVASAPDLILLTAEGEKALGGKENVWSLPGMALTPAAKHRRVVVVDDMALLGFGLETPAALARLRQVAEQVK